MKIAFDEGQIVKAGDLLAADRSAPVPGRARSGQGEEDAGRGQSRQRQARSAALLDARQAELRHPAAARHPGRAGQPADRADRGRRGRDRRRPGAARLHHNPRADLRARRVPPRRRGQYGGRVPADRHRRRSRRLQPIAVIFTAPEDDVARINAALARRRAARCRCKTSDGAKLLATGKLTVDRQSGRHHDRHDPAEGGVREQGQCALARPRGHDAADASTSTKNALVVPTAAVQHGPNGLFVYVVDDQNRAAMRPVTVSHEDQDLAVIDKG